MNGRGPNRKATYKRRESVVPPQEQRCAFIKVGDVQCNRKRKNSSVYCGQHERIIARQVAEVV